MLLWLTEQLTQYANFFSVFQYLTFRTLVSFITALLMSMFLGPSIIRRFQSAQIGEVIRKEGPTSHQSKAGTPTMGGTMIIIVWSLTTLLWGDLSNSYIWLAFFVVLSFGLVGWYPRLRHPKPFDCLKDFIPVSMFSKKGTWKNNKWNDGTIGYYKIPNFEKFYAVKTKLKQGLFHVKLLEINIP